MVARTSRWGKSMQRRLVLAASGFLLAGCAGTALELEQATDSQSDSVPDLVSAQIYHNLLLKDHDINEMPAQVIIASGSTQISNQIIVPSATANLTGILFRSFGLQNQNQWQQGWSVSAVADTGDLQRLDALYRYAWGSYAPDDQSKREFSDIRKFVIGYSKAAIIATSSTALRIFDQVDTQAIADDYNYPPLPSPYTPPKKKSSSSQDKPDQPPRTLFGPPANLPLPPQRAVQSCYDRHFATIEELDPKDWPVPFPSKIPPFIWIAGTRFNVHDDGAKPMGVHAMRAVYADQEAFAQFQLWVFGATANTAAGGKSSSTPSKGISGAGG